MLSSNECKRLKSLMAEIFRAPIVGKIIGMIGVPGYPICSFGGKAL
jgi:hypothetical protein